MTTTPATLREALAKATLPWFEADGGICSRECPEDGSNVVCLSPESVMAASLARWSEHAALIVAAVNALPGLLDALDEAVRERDEAYSLVSHWQAEHQVAETARDAAYAKGREDAARIAETFPVRETGALSPRQVELIQEHAEEIATAIRAQIQGDPA